MPAPSILSRLKQLIPGYAPRPTPPALVVETPDQRAARRLAEVQQQLDRSRGRPAPRVDEKVPANYYHGVAGKVWFLPYADSVTKDTPEIRAALRQMRKDGYVKAAWEPQIAAVASEDWQVQPAEPGNPEAEEQAEFVTRVFQDYLRGGMPSLVRAVCAPLGSDGFSVAEKVWAVGAKGRLEGKIVLEAAKPKDPEWLHVKGDTFNNVTHLTSTRKAGDEYPITDFLYSRYLTVFDEPLGEAAFRPAYGPYWQRDTVRKLRIIHCEKRMAGTLMGTYAADDDDQKAALEAALRQARSSTWISVPEGARVEALALSTASEPDYKSFDESLREEIVTSIAFATLQTMQGTVPDARGDSNVQKQTSDLGPWLLMTIVAQAVNEQLIPDLIDYNFPYPAAGGYPKLTFGAVSNAELLELVQIVEAAQRIGLKPSRKHYAGVLSIKEADPNDPDDQMQAAGQQPPMPPGGGFGGMGGDPFGGQQPDPFAFSEAWESFAWSPAKSRTGGVKAVGTAEDAGRSLYGRQAEAALARQGRTDRGEPHPEAPQEKAKRLAAEREPARAEARQVFARALEAPDKISPDEMAGLGERMKLLTRDELRGFARNMAARVGGLKPELVERLVAKAREKAAGRAGEGVAGVLGEVRGGAAEPGEDTTGTGETRGVPRKTDALGVSGSSQSSASGSPGHTIRRIKRGEAYTLDSGESKKRLGSDVYAVVNGDGHVVTTGANQHTYDRRHGAESAMRGIQQRADEGQPHTQTLATYGAQESARQQAEKAGNARQVSALAGQETDPVRRGELHADATATAQGYDYINKPSVAARHRTAVEAALAAGKPVPPEVLADYPDLAPTREPVAGATATNSPKIPSPAVDNTKGIGDTTPVPATPAGGGGKVMTTPTDPWGGVAAAAAALKDRRSRGITYDAAAAAMKSASKAAIDAALVADDLTPFARLPDDISAKVWVSDELQERYNASRDPAMDARIRRLAESVGVRLGEKPDPAAVYDDSPPSDWRETMARRAIEDAAKARAAERVEREMGR